MKIACIDIGGTYIKAGVLENGVLSGVAEYPTEAHKGGSAVLQKAAEIAAGMGAARIGVSTAGEVDSDKGVIRFACNIPGYTGMHVRSVLQTALGVPVAVENDVNAAAMGELAFGTGRGLSDFLMVSYGTGVGGAIVMNRRIYQGSTYSAGEFGGLLTHPDAVVPGDQGSGSYERYASTTALVEKARAQDPALCDGRKIFDNIGRPAVKHLVDNWIAEVAAGLVNLIHLFNPSVLVLGGGIMREAYILTQLNTVLRPMIKPSFQNYKLVPAALGNNAGLMGAGYLAGLLD